MKKTIILLVALLFAAMQGAFAQRTITGKVIDAEDGLDMAGVYVVVKGTLRGTSTDNNGNFTLTVPNDAIIVFSFIGFKTVELPVENQTRFNITLQVDANVLGNVVVRETRNHVIPPERAVVTAMGVVRDKVALTFSIHSISGEEINRAREMNFLFTLRDMIPGVNVSYTDEYNRGKLGDPIELTLRGIKSWSDSGAALLVVDGVPMGRLNGDLNSNFFWSLNPNDIENVTVLKSANAAILYGSDGANGVILIELKKH